MAKLVPIKCPNCGAGMNVGPKDEVATCNYCGASAFVRRPGRPQPPPPPPPMMPYGQYGQPPPPLQPQLYVDVPNVARGGAAIGIVVALVSVLGVVGAVVATTVRSSTMSVSGDDIDIAGGDPRDEAPENPVKAKNMERVDPADILRQAVKLAKKVEPKAKLISAHFTELEGGMLDLTAKSKGFVVFEYRWNDTSKKAGKDVVAGRFFINADKGAFNTWAHTKGTASHLRDEKQAKAFPSPLPGCTGKQAWAAAVKAGVPSDAVSTVHWDKVNAFGSAQKMQWSFRVEGHDEHRREIDASDCRMLRRWDKR